MIVLSRPATDFAALLKKTGSREPAAHGLYFYPRGRDALLAGLHALGVPPGETVVVPAYICDSTIAPLRGAGYRVLFVDVEPNFELDLAKVLAAVEQGGARAVLAVHYFGFPAGVARLVSALRPRGVRVIEDCCHSFLTRSGGQPVGLAGDAAIFSMRKTLPVPDGGALRLNTASVGAAALAAGRAGAPP
ncbi:DegT/DnrJ/EryC1/StrS family aminotransferase, partial [Massilia solisilvae]